MWNGYSGFMVVVFLIGLEPLPDFEVELQLTTGEYFRDATHQQRLKFC
jgi:hypothetical protein